MVWYFVRTAPGRLVPLAGDELEAFVRGERPLPADEDRWVRYVGVALQTSQRTPVGLERLWFARCRVREDGRLDQEHMLAVANGKVALGRRLHDAGDREPSPEEVLVDASAFFDARRFVNESTWQPEPDDVAALRELVNARAGWALL